MPAGRKALLVATYVHNDAGLRRLTSPAHDAEALAEVLGDPEIAGFDVTMLVNEPHYVVGEAIADFYSDVHRDDLALLYFTGHGVKDDDGRLYLATTNTRRNALMFTAISAAQVNDAMDACRSRRKVLVLDCCYSGAFPAGRGSKSDEGVQTLERFQGKGRVVLTASDATQYAFEGDEVLGSGTQSLFTRYLVEAIRTGEADLDEDGDIALDELYSYVHERVVAEMPQQRPKKLEDVDGRIVIARNVHWRLPEHLEHAIGSPIAAQRLSAVEALGHLHGVGNEVVRAAVLGQVAVLAEDDSRSVSARAGTLLAQLRAGPVPVPAEQSGSPPPAGLSAATPQVAAPPSPHGPADAPPATAARRPAVTSAVPTADQIGAGARPQLLLWLVVVSGALLGASRLAVFEESNTYRAASIDGFGTLAWTLGIGLPLLAAAVLLLGPVDRRWATPVVTGLLLGTAGGLTDQALTFLAYITDDDYGYTPGPGWWLSLGGLLLVLVAAVRAAPAGATWRTPAMRGDWAAVVGLVVVLAALSVWIWRFYPDRGFWVPALAPGVLLAAGCLPVSVLSWNDVQRRLGLAAVTVYGTYVVATQIQMFVEDSYVSDAPDAVAALGCALVMVATCHLSQRLRWQVPGIGTDAA